MTEENSDSFIYEDRDGTEIICKTQSEYDRRWRDRYLEDSGLNYRDLVALEGQKITLQIVGSRHYEQNVGNHNCIEVETQFIPLIINKVHFELDDGLTVDFQTDDFSIPIASHSALPIKKVQVLWITIEITPEKIFEWTEENEQVSKQHTPEVEVWVTPDKEWDERNSEQYCLSAVIELANGQVIGE